MVPTTGPPGSWRIHFFQRHLSDDPGESVPALDFFEGLTAKIAAEVNAVLDAVAVHHPPHLPVAASGRRCTATWPASTRRASRVTAGTTDSSACSSVMLSIWEDRRSCASAVYPSLDARRPKRGTTRASAYIEKSSSGIAASSTDASLFERFGSQLQLESLRECHERRQRWVGALGREKTPNHLGTKIGSARQLSLAQVEAAPALIEYADDRVDLVDTSARCVIRVPILQILTATREVALRPGPSLRDGHNYRQRVTQKLRAIPFWRGGGTPSTHERTPGVRCDLLSSGSRHGWVGLGMARPGTARQGTVSEPTKWPRGRPAKRALPPPIPDAPANIARAILTTRPKPADEWRYLTLTDDDHPSPGYSRP